MRRTLLFLCIVGPITALLAFALTRDPRALPSALIGKSAPAFRLVGLGGNPIDSTALAGAPVVVNFWSTWCGPCFQEQEILRRGRALYEPRGVKFIGVVYEDRESAVRAFLGRYGEPFEAALDPQSKMAIDYGVGGVPETFFIDAAGTIRHKSAGVLSWDELETECDRLLDGEGRG